MSGGSSKPDSYHQRDPPKFKKHIPNEIDIIPKTADGKICKIGKDLGALLRKQGSQKKVYWYRCDGCGQPFPSRDRRYGKTTSCSLACKYKVHSQRQKGRKHSPESIEKMRKAQEKAWKNPETADRRRKAAKTRKKPKQVQRKKVPKKVYQYRCAHCGKKFQTYRKKELDNKYCSRSCVGKSQRKGKFVKCDNPNCSNKMWRRPAQLNRGRHYCSTDCMHSDPYMKEIRSETSMGELNPNWKGGVGRLVGWERMVQSIRDRDEHTCQSCGREHEDGEWSFPVHHMRPESQGGPDESWNLATLCPSCHYAADAQEGDFKIPKDADGNPIRDLDDMMKHWEEFQNRQNEDD